MKGKIGELGEEVADLREFQSAELEHRNEEQYWQDQLEKQRAQH